MPGGIFQNVHVNSVYYVVEAAVICRFLLCAFFALFKFFNMNIYVILTKL